jgi:UDP-N-acetylglucosamine diphosphorylase / glucose-1-phosphate thymidylyltransferase / UDP-N-acetylgalactosamine diphosphorylase / glucosamine-1-phosphate N-acetyltransferase / galactosamine-1-phosphate N-acetyltransferase
MSAATDWKLNIVMPMAGLGSRFRDAGYSLPKPLIDVLGRPMYAWATESLPLDKSTRLIFILLASQPECPELTRDIQQRYAKHSPIVVTVPELTAGQAITVLRAKEFINNDEPCLIHNADTAFDVDHAWVEKAWHDRMDGALLVFNSNEKRWSFSRENAAGFVDEVREKEVISTWASTGTYWFRRGADFVRMAESRLNAGRREAAEYYVGPLYNDMIGTGSKVKNYPIHKLYCFGTPDDLTATLKQMNAAGDTK